VNARDLDRLELAAAAAALADEVGCSPGELIAEAQLLLATYRPRPTRDGLDLSEAERALAAELGCSAATLHQEAVALARRIGRRR
jgi:hypothetical protein